MVNFSTTYGICIETILSHRQTPKPPDRTKLGCMYSRPYQVAVTSTAGAGMTASVVARSAVARPSWGHRPAEAFTAYDRFLRAVLAGEDMHDETSLLQSPFLLAAPLAA